MRFVTHPLADAKTAAAFGKSGRDLSVSRRLSTSLALLTAGGDTLTATFYGLLFSRHPALRPMFPADMTNQRAKLLQTLEWVVNHLEIREQVLPALADLGQRHVAYGALPEHYPVVVDLLLEAMAQTAGSQWSSELAADWRAAMELIAARMIEGASRPVSSPDGLLARPTDPT